MRLHHALPVALLVAGCQHPVQQSRVVLLPDKDGRVGSLVVKTPKGQRVLNSALASVTVDDGGLIHGAKQDAAGVREQFAAALEASPPRPASFAVYFESGSAVDFIAASRPVLDRLRVYLKAHPAPEIAVIGHTDRVGSVQSNDTLSRQRAETVRGFLVEAGIDPTHMEVAGRGEREPLVPTADEVAEERNRRVEINVR